ncbi:hypothetical protein Z043_105797 [Scleropages formosus]|uniref:KASH domain-containing protein n=1 Tax=Scleropages formosus TaxID=113540 RepID=A0A0P7UXU9_SCLFO|nr:hypothetical protein Z043_105797 [Scleropages formosus]
MSCWVTALCARRFGRDSTALSEWMGEASDRLRLWRQESVSVLQDPRLTRAHLAQVLELSKEAEGRSSLKVSVLSAGERLLELKETDTAALQLRLSQLEQSWAQVLCGLPAVQEKLHQLLMERLPSQEAMKELHGWIAEMEARLKEMHVRVQGASSAASFAQLLQKYKEMKIEMAFHQLTVDFVSQSMLQMSCPDNQGKRYECISFAEQLGALSHRWIHIQGELESQIRQAEQLEQVCKKRETKLRLLCSWVRGHMKRLPLLEEPENLSAVLRALKECEEIEKKIKVKSAELQDLRAIHIPRGGTEHLQLDGDFVAQTDDAGKELLVLSQQLCSLRKALEQLRQQWGLFRDQLEEVLLSTAKCQYVLDCKRGSTITLHGLQNHAKHLEVLQHEMEMREALLDTLAANLSTLKVSPPVALLLCQQLESGRKRWIELGQELAEEQRRVRDVLRRWREFSRLLSACSQRLQRHQEDSKQLLGELGGSIEGAAALQELMEAVTVLQKSVKDLQSSVEEVLEAAKELTKDMDPQAAIFIHTDTHVLLRGAMKLSGTLSRKRAELQEELEQLQGFSSSLESLEQHLQDCERRLAATEHSGCSGVSQPKQLELSTLSPDLDALNELSHRVALSEQAARRLQSLNRKWARASLQAVEKCSELQAEVLRFQSFEQKCKSWMDFLQSMEDSLAVPIAGSFPSLQAQLRVHQRFQVEVSIGHQILHSVISEALQMLERGEVEDRSDFLLKLSQLRGQFQAAVRRAQQRGGLVAMLVAHWHLYTRSLARLKGLLTNAHDLLPPVSPAHWSVQQLSCSQEELKRMETLFQRHQSTYMQTLEVGRQLFSMGDAETQAQLQTELGSLQEDWEKTCALLQKRRNLADTVLQTWDRSEAGLADGERGLEEVKRRLKQAPPERLDELQTEERLIKECEGELEDWACRLTELATMKTDLSQYIMGEDTVLLGEQVEGLHQQWEELCLKVSLRKQEIADRLNAWVIFNEKNKELCEWLTQMENKVAHSANLSIEEMVEKLKKDCMEEINLFSENKTHLKQLGEQLISASDRTKGAEVNNKLMDVNDRWQHLFDHIEARVRKLKDTLVTVQQLDKNMSNLRTWLSRIEAELAKPVVYSVCHNDEIQRKLAEQQDLQRDIEQHTEGVASVLSLCEVLLRDGDACSNEAESESIQETTRSLDRRWRNICAMSMERRMRIEETWRLWCKFLEDYSRFEDWLKTAEITAANPNSADVLYTSAKEELKKFEAFQRQVHERLTQLELVNKQYRRLARENRTDSASRLKHMVQEGNQRWDVLQRRVTAILRRLKVRISEDYKVWHFTSQREEFEGTREALLVWLTEMDLQLTNVEHFSESDVHDKMRQLDAFQQEITLNTNRIDQLIVFGENLIQKSAPLDAVLIEDELEELHSYCQEVFGRVARFHHRLTSRRPVLDEERDLSDRDTDVEDSGELVEGTWRDEGGGLAGRQATCHLLPPPLERSGRETPASVDSIPLEWDHTGDVGGSSSPEDEDDVTFYSALSGKSISDPSIWHSPEPQDRKHLPSDKIHSLGSSPMNTSTPYQQGYAKLMMECSGSIDRVKRVKLILNDEEQSDEQGLTGLGNADKQSGVIERWELLEAQALSDQLRIKHNLQKFQQLTSDLSDIMAWLDHVLPQLERRQRLEACTSIQDVEASVRELKEMQKSFDRYKVVMISVNLSGRQLQQGGALEAGELQEGLHKMNQGWAQACAGLDSWEQHLYAALMQCQDFHETLHSLLLLLARVESKRYAVNVHKPSLDRSVLVEQQATLRGLEEELLGRRQQVRSLQEISSQLLLEASGEDSVEAKEKVHVIANKLRLLLRQVAHDLRVLEGRLNSWSPAAGTVDGNNRDPESESTQLLHPKEASEETGAEARPLRVAKRDPSPPRSFFCRVLRAAFPLHLLFLLLLVLTCLVPLSEDDYRCALSNNFARSFYPMLHYTNGPPPT